MRVEALGFAPAWENAWKEGEQHFDKSATGFVKLFSPVLSRIGNRKAQSSHISDDHKDT